MNELFKPAPVDRDVVIKQIMIDAESLDNVNGQIEKLLQFYEYLNDED